jgi:hypothetical protein
VFGDRWECLRVGRCHHLVQRLGGEVPESLAVEAIGGVEAGLLLLMSVEAGKSIGEHQPANSLG